MTPNERDNAYAMCLLILVTPFYTLLHPRETREGWGCTSDAYRKLNQKR